MPTTEFDWEPCDGQCLTFEVSYTAEPFRPAVINADPDRCHPAEGGICVDDVELKSIELTWFDDENTTTTWKWNGFNWPFGADLAARAETAVLKMCEDELREACHAAANEAHERALADRDDARELEP